MQLPTRQTAEAVSDGSLLRKVSQVKVGRRERDKTENEEGHVILPESQLVPFHSCLHNENESYNDNNLAHMYVV